MRPNECRVGSRIFRGLGASVQIVTSYDVYKRIAALYFG